MSKPKIVVRAALTIGGPSVYHEIRGNALIFIRLLLEVLMDILG
jgi:hypothetical protein